MCVCVLQIASLYGGFDGVRFFGVTGGQTGAHQVLDTSLVALYGNLAQYTSGIVNMALPNMPALQHCGWQSPLLSFEALWVATVVAPLLTVGVAVLLRCCKRRLSRSVEENQIATAESIDGITCIVMLSLTGGLSKGLEVIQCQDLAMGDPTR